METSCLIGTAIVDPISCFIRRRTAVAPPATSRLPSTSKNFTAAVLLNTLRKSGADGRARGVLGALEEISRGRYLPPYATALVHAGLGEPDAAFAWLDR